MDEIKVCPFCGETINLQAKKCKYCGEWLKNERNYAFVFGKFHKVILRTFISIITIGLFLCGYNLYQNQYNVDEVSYKSISNMDDTVESLSSSLSACEFIEQIIQQEKDLNEYLKSTHSVREKTGVFKRYYKNLNLLIGSIPIELPEFWNDGSSNLLKYLNSYGILFKSHFISNFDIENDRISYLTFEKPKINLFEIIYVGEGCYGFTINDSYIADSYAKYLNEAWKDYMNNKKRIFEDLEHRNYYNDGSVIPDGKTVAYWVIMWERFLKKYPNFELKKEINENINNYSSDILYRKYFIEYDEKKGKEYLRNDLRTGCEYYLENANKNTKRYKMIKQDYETWKKNNFEYNKQTEEIYLHSHE